jgi:hypothetical protein
MRRVLQVGVLGGVCFVAGWCVGHFGPDRAWAQEHKDKEKDTHPFTNLLGYELMVRQPGEVNITKDSTTVELEVYRDNRHGNLVYVTGAGAIAVVKEDARSAKAEGRGN